MTLKEKLESLDCANVKIGAQTNFIYCGEPDADVIQALSDEKRVEQIEIIQKALENLSNIDGQMKTDIKSATRSYLRESYRRWNYERVMRDDGTITDDAANSVARKVGDSLDNFFHRKKVTLEKFRRAIEKISPWIALLDRQVLESYWSVDEPDTLIILIEGSEVGKFWTTQEYKRGVVVEDGDEE